MLGPQRSLPGGLREAHRGEVRVDATHNVAMVPLATPFLAGPGAISAFMLFFRSEPAADARWVIVGALTVVLVIAWLAMWLSEGIRWVLRDTGIEFLTRVMGLLLAAIAVQFVA